MIQQNWYWLNLVLATILPFCQRLNKIRQKPVKTLKIFSFFKVQNLTDEMPLKVYVNRVKSVISKFICNQYLVLILSILMLHHKMLTTLHLIFENRLDSIMKLSCRRNWLSEAIAQMSHEKNTLWWCDNSHLYKKHSILWGIQCSVSNRNTLLMRIY